ncbi:CinA family protein [Phenylobacterium sp.]|uniref:CinA family protein n=1 Tax=Phenylobacterium sp. TaxID=1871053 RepID=UPI0028988E0B|nr:CinA family protein [Phenylobacterium sp.]
MAEALSPILPPQLEALTHEVLRAASNRELKLATAESCTGGLIASLLTDVPGRSHVFERAFVTYSNAAKQQLLGIRGETLRDHGPVSEEAVRQMAMGALANSGADIVLAVTGWCEAGPDPGQQAGLVWFAVAARGRPLQVRMERFGNIGRAGVRLACLQVGLDMLHAAVLAH